jgi:hypothetical protein
MRESSSVWSCSVCLWRYQRLLAPTRSCCDSMGSSSRIPGMPFDPTRADSGSLAYRMTISGSVRWDNATHAQVPTTAEFRIK